MNQIITPYEKYQSLGPESLTDVELLSILIRNGTSKKDALAIADELLGKYDRDGRIIGLFNLTADELMEYEGIGRVKAMCIGSLFELSKRISKQKKQEALSLSSPSSIADYYMEQLRHLMQETTYLLILDVKCNILKEIKMTSGTINSSLVSVRDIFVYALLYKASGIVLLHNHPSGDSTPSRSDISLTAKLKEASEFMDIPLIDHIIIGDMNYFSFKSKGYI